MAGKIPINLKDSHMDMLSLSGHKLHAPKGVGILYIRKGVPFARSSSVATRKWDDGGARKTPPASSASGKPVSWPWRIWKRKNTRVKDLRDKLERGILAAVPNTRVNGGKAPRLPNTSNISFEFIEGEAILLQMDGYGICASSGSACTSGSLQPSHVLRAMGVPFTMAHGSIRFSLSIYNTEEEIDFVVKTLPPIIEKLRALSPFWEAKAKSCGADKMPF